ncbi:PRC-barrel domain-containing protein [Thalassobaculum sp. OXR-137]|uniref:PRC-barrel domain-containing protein n=1 Tax=Thalassobaculum sp. OXR-137 TaxID=3100173 RepID=UPI002AC932FF|nr:PRC-barrel domain-containing protein [Thalassobaculum sp. OXR-137]WPZ35344.1 PRC-barrel domain-containing protein [Thalassobaculum sp. OXR-137]
MRRKLLAGAGALSLAVAAFATVPSAPVQADTSVVVVDATDLYRSPGKGNGPRLSELSGQAVYSNSGKQLGVIEDFAIGRGGEVVAVIDTDNGPLDELFETGSEDILIIPLRELRTAPMASLHGAQ